MSQLKYYNGSAWVEAIVGVQGATGATGPQGATGPSGAAATYNMLGFEKTSDVTGSGTVAFDTTAYVSAGTSFGTMAATGVFTFSTAGVYQVTVAFNVSANPDGWGGVNGTTGTRYNQANWGGFSSGLKSSAVDVITVNVNDTYEWKTNNSVTVYGSGTTKTRIQFTKLG